MAENTSISERVVVALNVLRHDIGMLELAAQLAARKQAQLIAVYVEETNLINLAELPFAIEVDRICASERKVDLPRLMRALRSNTEQIQQTLDRLNERLQIDVSFRTVRGHFVSAVLSEIEQIDVVFLSKSEPYRSNARKTTAIYPIWVVFDGSRGAERALQVAVELAELTESSLLHVVLPAKTDAESEALRQLALKCCVRSTAVHFVTVYPLDVSNLLRSMRRTGCRLLVVKREDGDLSKAISEAAACPVVLI